ncbi:BHLH domain-containing protein [Mycena chlorophos]|uniref:BHLH domain-containing protein n=1 Tax=Mycena chlorophos TaxID=658473 RepID=A0A8H6SNG9_MYCCL|nr:BHLH domain-containing protein [Mycena chlorophos]
MEHHPDSYAFYTPDGHEQQPYYPTAYHGHQVQQRHQVPLELQQFHQPYPFYPQQAPSPHVQSIEPSPPPSPDQMYSSDGPISPQLSGSDTSADGIYSPQASPTSSRANSLVQRHGRSYDPTPSPTGSIPRRSRRGRSHGDSDDEDAGYGFGENVATTRKEATRQQRIQAEQRRRDELRDGYAKLKDVLPVSNQKSSKVSLLERATTHIAALELENKSLNERIASLEEEIRRLQALNDKLGVGALETPSPGMYERPLSPPPEVQTPATHILHPSSSLVGANDLRGEDGSTATTPSDRGY